MNALDIVILLLFVPGIIRGLSKGFLEQVISLVGIVVAVWAAFKFSNAACEWLKTYITVSETVLHIIAFALILVAALLAVMLLAKLVTQVAKMASLGWLNKLLGFAFSVAASALIIGIVIILFDTVNVKFELVKSPVLEESVLYGHLKDLGYFVFPYLKQLLTKAS